MSVSKCVREVMGNCRFRKKEPEGNVWEILQDIPEGLGNSGWQKEWGCQEDTILLGVWGIPHHNNHQRQNRRCLRGGGDRERGSYLQSIRQDHSHRKIVLSLGCFLGRRRCRGNKGESLGGCGSHIRMVACEGNMVRKELVRILRDRLLPLLYHLWDRLFRSWKMWGSSEGSREGLWGGETAIWENPCVLGRRVISGLPRRGGEGAEDSSDEGVGG